MEAVSAQLETERAAVGESEAAPAEWVARHAVNIRLSIPFFFGRFYLTIVAGRERRDTTRLKDERQKHPLSTLGNLTFLFFLGTVGGLAMLAMIQFLGSLALQGLGVTVAPG